MDLLLTLGLATAVAVFARLTVLFLDARSKRFDALRAHARGNR